MSNQNIYRVTREEVLDKILNDHFQKLITVMFSSKTCGPCIEAKPQFIKLSQKYRDCMFVYVDLSNYEDRTRKFTKTVEGTPKFCFFFGNKEVGFVMGARTDSVEKGIIDLSNRINNQREKLKQQELYQQQLLQQKHEQEQIQQQLLQQKHEQEQLLQQKHEQEQLLQQKHEQKPLQQRHEQLNNDENDDLEIVERKITVIKRLKEVTGNKYSINMSFRDLVNEFERLTREPTNEDIQKKQEEYMTKQTHMKQIQELNRLNQMMQMQQLQKLHQLKQFKKMKEDEEKKEKGS